MISIDPEPMGVPNAFAGIELIKRTFRENFEFKQMTSVEFFDTFTEDVRHLRLLGIVDGDHSPEGCLKDLIALEKLGARQILVDDTNWLPPLKRVAETFAAEHGYNFMNLDLYNGVGLLTAKR